MTPRLRFQVHILILSIDDIFLHCPLWPTREVNNRNGDDQVGCFS